MNKLGRPHSTRISIAMSKSTMSCNFAHITWIFIKSWMHTVIQEVLSMYDWHKFMSFVWTWWKPRGPSNSNKAQWTGKKGQRKSTSAIFLTKFLHIHAHSCTFDFKFNCKFMPVFATLFIGLVFIIMFHLYLW